MNDIEFSITTRPFQNGDRKNVIDLWKSCALVVPWNDPEKDIDAKVGFQPELFLVGELDGKIVASVMAGYEGRRGWINYLAVLPDLQGRGIGKRIMEEAEKKLKNLGCQKINLCVRTSNESVIGFYEHLGFSVDEVVCMGKRL
ncbi:GNAT family acetyltransferase [Candidatus Hydrogenedentota bacterium]